MANNPLYVVYSGTWRPSWKSYVWTSGRWYRIHGAYAYTSVYGRLPTWYPVFEYGPIDLPPPTNLHGITGTHTTATFGWNPVTDPFSEGYRMHLRYGSDKSGGIIWTHPSDGTLYPRDATSFKWENLVPDNTYHFTMQSFDEFGKAGPESPGITFQTGHTALRAYNPSYPGADSVFVTPIPSPWAEWGTKTYMEGKGQWAGNSEVRQGKSKDYPGQGQYKGCVRYSKGIYNQLYDHFAGNWGLTPPRGTITVHDALFRRVTRLKVNVNSGTVKTFVASGDCNFADDPVRRHWDESWFTSPEPNAARTDFRLSDTTLLPKWTQHWLNGGEEYNGIILFNNSPGTANNDGTHMVVFSRAEGNNWHLQLWVTFDYQSRAVQAARWV